MKLTERERRKRQLSDAASEHSDEDDPPPPPKKRPPRGKAAATKVKKVIRSSVKKAVSFLSPQKSPAATSSFRRGGGSIASSEIPSLRSASSTGSLASSFAFRDASSIAASSLERMPALSRISSAAASSSSAMDVDQPEDAPRTPPNRRASVEDSPESDEDIRETRGPARPAHRFLVEDEDEDDDAYTAVRRRREADDVGSSRHSARTPSPEEEISELTDEQELEKMRKGFRSPIYAFYDAHIDIEYRKTKYNRSVQKHHVFACAARGCKTRVPRNLETKDRTSSKNLKTHAEKCWGVDTVKAALESHDLEAARGLVKKHKGKNGLLTTVFARLKSAGAAVYSHIPLTKAETRAECVRWVAESFRPFNVVKDRGFLRLIKSGRPETYVPHPTTVSRDSKVLFAKTRKRLARKLQDYEGRISIAVDGWTAPNHRPFLGYSVHWQEKGQPVSAMLDFRELAESHSGAAMAQLTEDVVREFGLEHKVLSITCDNAAPNDVMVEHLGRSLPGFDGPLARTRCFAHVVNLVAKSLLQSFDPPKKKKKGKKKTTTPVDNNDDDDDDDEPDAEQINTIADDEVDLVDVMIQVQELERDDPNDVFDEVAEMTEEDRAKFKEETKAVSSALKKVRRISFGIINSPTILLPRWNAILDELALPRKKIPRDVSTRWNSTFDMLNVTLQYKRAIKDIVGEDQLERYRLNNAEWEVLENLRDVLQAFKDATLFFSRQNATLATVIPAMDKLDTLLATAVLRKASDTEIELSDPVKAALLVAKNTLNRYYNLTDQSDVYRIALILHPRHKFGYFDDRNWLQSWKDDARALIEDVFSGYEEAYNEQMEDETPLRPPSSSAASSSSNMFDNLDNEPIPNNANPMTELQIYLAEPRVPHISNVLQWWLDHEEKFPILSRMALDYLSVPPTSVDVERFFSRGRLLITHIRNRLSAQTARALMCLGSWSRLELIHDDDMRAVTSLPQVPEAEGDENGDVLLPDGFANMVHDDDDDY